MAFQFFFGNVPSIPRDFMETPNIKGVVFGQGTVVRAYTPSYSAYRDQEDHGSRLAQAKTWQDPISTNTWAYWHMPIISAMWSVVWSHVIVY
jgi:hypothetical protein